MPREASEYPKDIKEFVTQGWEQNIRFRIRAFNLKDSLNNPEDLVQDVLLALMETHYLDRYSPDKGSFKTYLYGFVDNLLKKRFNKENTRHGKFIVSAASLVIAAPESDAEFNGREVFAELLDAGIDDARTVEIHAAIAEIRKELKDNYVANSSFTYNGVEYQRDPLTVFDLLMEDYSVKEVSTMLDVSRQFIYHLMKKIRETEAFKDLMDVQDTKQP